MKQILDKLRHWTLDSIKFKLILPVVLLQIFSTNIGQLVNSALNKGRQVISDAGVNTSYMDGNIGFFVSSGLSILISVFILILLYDRIILRRLLNVAAFTGKLGDGDLSVALKFKGNDDIGRLGSSLVKSSSNIRNLVTEIESAFNQLHATSELLQNSTRNSADSIQSIHSTASLLAEDALRLI
ncbi:MAG: methyl-accepting chemotaxis protein, partial [Paenibacillus sp.]